MNTRTRRLARWTAAWLLLVTQGVSAQEWLPAGYWNRFDRIQVVASTAEGFGVRYFPLPIQADLRLNLAKRPNYWEYALSTRLYDTTLAAGVFDNGAEAKKGIPRIEATHDPTQGWQGTALWQGEGALSRLSTGYAWLLAGDRVRVLQNAGFAAQGATQAPFTETIVTAGMPEKVEDLSLYFSTTARAYAYPTLQKAQGSVDLVASASLAPATGLLFDGYHIERFVVGESGIAAFNLARYQGTSFNTTYRLPYQGDPEFALGAVRERVYRDWTNRTTWLHSDVLFRTKYLSVMVGPSFSYFWSADGQTNKWVIGLSSLGK